MWKSNGQPEKEEQYQRTPLLPREILVYPLWLVWLDTCISIMYIPYGLPCGLWAKNYGLLFPTPLDSDITKNCKGEEDGSSCVSLKYPSKPLAFSEACGN